MVGSEIIKIDVELFEQQAYDPPLFQLSRF